MKIQIGDKVRVVTKLEGDKLCIVDWINGNKIHFKNKSKFGLTVNIENVKYTDNVWRGSNFKYISFN